MKKAFFAVALVITASPVVAQEKVFRMPPATPVTCSKPESTKISEAARVHFGATTENISRNWNRWNEGSKKMREFTSPWYEQCWRVCKGMNPIRPVGYDWRYSGQYGRKTAYASCSHDWIRLLRKDGDRISVVFTGTNALDKSTRNNGIKYPRDSVVISCSRRDWYDDSRGWSPIKPYTKLDDAIQKFC